jgi:KilA-N domain
MSSKSLELYGKVVGEDQYGFVSLTDLWVMAGKPKSKTPARWQQNPGAKALLAAFEEKVGYSYLNANSATGSAIYAMKGRGRRTFAHAVIALGYAQALDPKLAVDVNQLFLRYKTDAVTLAMEIIEGMTEQAEYDELRVRLRRLVKDHNRMSAGAAKEAGVKNFEAYNGAGLKGLYGGMTKAEVLAHKGLPADAHHLDHAGHEELASNYFKATQAEAKLKRDGIQGQATANLAHMQVGEAVRNTIKGLGGTMPEDEPALEHIKQAEKRLKAATPREQKSLPKRKGMGA